MVGFTGPFVEPVVVTRAASVEVIMEGAMVPVATVFVAAVARVELAVGATVVVVEAKVVIVVGATLLVVGATVVVARKECS